MFEDEATWLILELGENDPWEDLVDEYLAEILVTCREDVENMKIMLYRFYNKYYPEADEERKKLRKIYLNYCHANDVPEHTDDPVYVVSIVETVEHK